MTGKSITTIICKIKFYSKIKGTFYYPFVKVTLQDPNTMGYGAFVNK